MRFRFVPDLEADDVFISYYRDDASAYVNGLDAALAARDFECFTDKRGTEADEQLPETLFRRIRACNTCVLLGRPGAMKAPHNITQEMKEFADAKGTARIIAVSFDRSEDSGHPDDWSRLSWWPYVKGKSRERETPNALLTGEPSPAVIEAIVKASDYMKSKDRLRRYRVQALSTLAVLLFAIFAAGTATVYLFKAAARAKAAAAAADVARNTADEKKKEALAAAETAQARADDQGAIADSRAGAIQSQSASVGVQRSIGLAIGAVAAVATRGLQTVESDTALRKSLAMLPRRIASYQYDESISAAALSPDGGHLALLTKGDVVRIYAVGSSASLMTKTCGPARIIAISNGATHVAVASHDTATICDTRSDAKHSITLVKNDAKDNLVSIDIDDIALSPDGRYLAMIKAVRDESTQSGKANIVNLLNDAGVWDVESGKQIARLSEGERNQAISFNAVGDLALGTGGGTQVPSVTGSVSIWPLSRGHMFETTPRMLTQADFAEVDIHPQAESVSAVTSGPGGWNYATGSGIWKRDLIGQLTKSLSLPVKETDPMYPFSLAFNGGETALVLLRYLPPRGARKASRIALELWDTEERPDIVHAFVSEKAQSACFSPDDRSVAAAFDWGEANPRRFDSANGSEYQLGQAVGSVNDRPEVKFVSDDARFAVSADDRTLFVRDAWQPATMTVTFGKELRGGRACQAALSRDAAFLAIAGQPFDGSRSIALIYRRNAASYELYRRTRLTESVGTFSNRPGDFGHLAITTDGERLVHFDNEGVRVFDSSTGRNVTPAHLHELQDRRSAKHITSFALSPTGRYLAIVSEDECKTDQSGAEVCDSDVNVLQISSGDVVSHVTRGGQVTALVFSPTEQYLLSASEDTKAGLTDLRNRVTTKVSTTNENIRSAAFSPDEQYLAVGTDNDIIVMSARKPSEPLTILPAGGSVTAVAFSHDGRRLVAATARDSHFFHAFWMNSSHDKSLSVWVFRSEDMLPLAVSRLKEIPDYLRDDDIVANAQAAAEAGLVGLARRKAR